MGSPRVRHNVATEQQQHVRDQAFSRGCVSCVIIDKTLEMQSVNQALGLEMGPIDNGLSPVRGNLHLQSQLSPFL